MSRRGLLRAASSPIRLNLGCGLNAPLGWVNVDRSPSRMLDDVPLAKPVLVRLGIISDAQAARWPRHVVSHDITRGLPFPAATVDAVYSSHALEHVHLDAVRDVLADCRRVLRPGGVLRLALPDGDRIAADLVASGGAPGAGLRYTSSLLDHPVRPTRGIRRIVELFGANVHRWQPTRSLVRDLLVEAGFAHCEERTFRVGGLPDLEVIEHRDESLFFEAWCD